MPPAFSVARNNEQNFVSGDSGQTDKATLQVNEEQDVVCHQPTPGEHFDCEEIDAGQHRHMRLNEFLPGRGLAPLRRWRNPVALQNIPYGLIRNGVTRDWPARPQCGRTPNQNSLWPYVRSGLPVSVRFGVCRGSDGIWSHRTSGQSACDTKPEWYRVWPRRRFGPEPCARVACRFRPTGIFPDRTSVIGQAGVRAEFDSL